MTETCELSEMNSSQRSLAAARTVNTRPGSNQYRDDVTTVADAAKIFGISKRSVLRARQILDKGTPEQIAAIESGSAAVYATNIRVTRELPKGDARYRDRFLRSVAVALQSARMLELTPLPPLSKEELDDVLKDIAGAKAILSEITTHLKGDVK